MQDKQITNQADFSEIISLPTHGRILSFDLGTKKIGVAVCDELQFTARPLPRIARRKWEILFPMIVSLIEEYDAIAIVLGLPYEYDGSESIMSADARKLQMKLADALEIPIFLQDERLTTKSAQQDLYDRGYSMKEILERLDSEAAAIILEDFLSLKEYQTKKQKGLI